MSNARPLPPDDHVRHIRVDCPVLESVRLRVAISPMHTTHASLFEVLGGWRRGADERWADQMMRRARDVDLAPLELYTTETRLLPNALCPLPDRPSPTFAEQLDGMARTPDDVIRSDLHDDFGDAVPPEYQPWLDEPAERLRRYVDALSAWWTAVVAPEWLRMAAVLETEVLRISRRFATQGLERTLTGIHPRLRWSEGSLVWPGNRYQKDLVLSGEILLLPMACGPNGLLTTTRDGIVSFAYGAPGSGALFGGTSAGADDGLTSMLGGGRAAILRSLDEPMPMRAVKESVGLATSTVCEHLHALEGMQLAASGRVGRYVVYARTDRGDKLVRLF